MLTQDRNQLGLKNWKNWSFWTNRRMLHTILEWFFFVWNSLPPTKLPKTTDVKTPMQCTHYDDRQSQRQRDDHRVRNVSVEREWRHRFATGSPRQCDDVISATERHVAKRKYVGQSAHTHNPQIRRYQANFYRATLCVSAVFAVARCRSVRLSVCRVGACYPHGWRYRQTSLLAR